MTVEVLIVGAGGIGGLLTDHVSRALAFSGLAEKVGGVTLTLMDGDIVEPRNLPHQRFKVSDVGHPKVLGVIEPLSAAGISDRGVQFVALAENLSAETDLSAFDLVVVAVDRAGPRKFVHEQANEWLDLRASGDGFVSFSHETSSAVRDSLPEQNGSASCQLAGAIESGHIQFGFADSAAHGAQWIIQWFRIRSGEPTALPSSRMYSIHWGELPFPTIEEVVSE